MNDDEGDVVDTEAGWTPAFLLVRLVGVEEVDQGFCCRRDPGCGRAYDVDVIVSRRAVSCGSRL